MARYAVLTGSGGARYPAGMDRVTLETLRAAAAAQGLPLSEEELARLLPLVQAGQRMLDSLDALLTLEVEPASQYRMF
jgi:hypothetical protein